MQSDIVWSRPIHLGIMAITAVLCGGCASFGGDSASATSPGEMAGIVRAASSQAASADELMYQLMAGELAGQFGDLDGSVAYYMRAARLSDDPRVAERAASIALYAEDEGNALQAAQRWVELNPASLEGRQTLAMLLVRSDDAAAAMTHFDYLIERSPGASGNGFLLIGASLSQEKDSAAALEAMRLLVDRHADQAAAHYAYANLALAAEQHGEAVEAADRALAINADLLEASVVRARALLGLGDTAEAVDGMRQAVESAPDNVELRTAYAKMLVQVERFDQAREEFGALLEQRPADPDLLYTLGLLDLQQENYAEAGEHFARLIETGKRVDEARYYLGRVAQEARRFDEAIKWFNQVEEDQYKIDAQARIASILAEQGELGLGRDHLRRARAEASDIGAIVQLYLAEGQILGQADEYQAGLDLFDRALTEFPGNSDLLYARALMAEKVGRIDQLEADLRTILEEDPDNATALNALGFTLADRNERVQEAFGYITRAYEARPDDPAVIDSMGWVHFRLGDYAQAEQFLRRAFKLMPDGEIAGHLSELMWAQGDKEEARSLLREALDKEPLHEYLLELRQRYTQ